MNVNKPNKSNFSMGDSKKFLRLPAVKEKTGKSRSSLYLMMYKGEFPRPRPIKLGERSVAGLNRTSMRG